MNNRFIAIVSLIAAAALIRLLPQHIPNFAPMGAMALFAGVYISNRYLALSIPLLALLFSDILIQMIGGVGFYGTGMIVVYACTALFSILGFAISKRTNIVSVAGVSIIGSILFFLITNCVWVYSNTFYPHNWQGIIDSYMFAIPFFKNSVVGDLFYSSVLFGGYYLLRINVPSLKQQEVKV